MKEIILVGIDEVGRGPIAGPVTVGIFVCEKNNLNKILKSGPGGLKDSKKLTKIKREVWSKYLHICKKEKLCNFVVVSVSAKEIDKIGINKSIQKSIDSCLNKLNKIYNLKSRAYNILLDGGLKPPVEYKKYKTIIKGDEKEPVIAMASIVAKVKRDQYMVKMSLKYSNYGFEKHMGYGTQMHYKALKDKGLTNLHRKTYLKNILD